MIISQIVHIYENIMPKLPIMLPHDEAVQYFERLMMNGNIITVVNDGELEGFLEYWNISNEQFGRICCNVTLAHEEDLLNGNICLITRMYITPGERNGHTFLHLGSELLRRTKNVTHYAALQMHKKHKPIQTYTRSEILKHYRMEI
jgi:DNA-directed RNA polymerase subunit H (RpoH/RPB5)